MIINKALRKQLTKVLPKNYRLVIVERLKQRGLAVHPNTVSNVLRGSKNNAVALELLKLYNEEKKAASQIENQLENLADAIVGKAA